MKTDFDALKGNIDSLPVGDEEKANLLRHLKVLEKDLLRMDFKLKRTLKDKSIAINLLNRTIEDLQEHQSALSRQNEEIEHQNRQLEKQKILLERQAKRLEDNLERLEASYEELEQFSYIASHDLKSPLRTIASYAQLLKRRYGEKLGKEADDFINYIVTGSRHMDEIIRDLLEYSRSAKEKEFKKTDLNNTLNLVKQNLRHEILESDAEIHSNELPELVVNASGMVQLFQNLIGNAIKFRNSAAPIIQIKSDLRNGYWYFEVQDNGLGMDEKYHEKAFLPFQRINNLDRPGTGMGLAICKKIVQMHKGQIWFKSTIGMGTTFSFTISEM